MDADLKRLLAIEEEAEKLVAEAQEQRQARISAAREEAEALQQELETEREAIFERHLQKARERANQAITELQRRYEEQDALLRASAEAHQDAALSDALRLFSQTAAAPE